MILAPPIQQDALTMQEAFAHADAQEVPPKPWRRALFDPGVTLVQSMGMRGKLALTALVFAMPVVLMLWAIASDHHRDAMGIAVQERVVNTGALVLPLQDALIRGSSAQNRRQLLEQLAQVRDQWREIEGPLQPGSVVLHELLDQLSQEASKDRPDVDKISTLLSTIRQGVLVLDAQFSDGNPRHKPLNQLLISILPSLHRAVVDERDGWLKGQEHPSASATLRIESAQLALVHRLVPLDQVGVADLTTLLKPFKDARARLSQDQVSQLLAQLIKTQQQAANLRAEAHAAHRAAVQNRTLSWMIALVVLAIAEVYLMGSLVHATSDRREAVSRMVEQMSHGNFAGRVDVQGSDEVAQTLLSLNESFDRMAGLLAAVQTGASAIKYATEQLSSGNNDLSERNRRTTAGLQEVVKAVTRYASQLESCGREIESVAGTVQALRCEAASNRKQMARLQERMNGLREHSRDIAAIVTLIDSISFRTNVLALNASIEASKAGEAGRGFAVVAQEVRALARRSADSSKQIADIVRRSTEDIDLGAAMADETSRVIEAADRHVDAIHRAISDVASLTREGESESAVILDEVRALSDVTERNTALVEQLACASQSLHRQGAILTEKVHEFKIE